MKTWVIRAIILGILAFFVWWGLVSLMSRHETKPAHEPVSGATTTAMAISSSQAVATSTDTSATVPQPQTTGVQASLKKTVMTTLFWTGEPSDSDNDYIDNISSAWDSHWTDHYGGVDDPNVRCGYRPCAFAPKENPFYFALPYGEYDDNGNLKASAANVPWFGKDRLPLLKNRWISVTHGNRTCYGQWEDVGPFESDDFNYVFGKSNR